MYPHPGLVAPAQYWHDPYDQPAFLASSAFLADINNQRSRKKTQYKEALTNLQNFVLVKWINDTSVIPGVSSHFGFYKLQQDNITLSLQELPIYQEDWLGLKVLDLQGKLHFMEMEGDHMDFNWPWFTENIVIPFLL